MQKYQQIGNICEVHDIIDGIEQDMFKKFGCITTIHMDPIVVDNEEINEMKKTVVKVVKEINSKFSIHDFRMTNGGKRVNVIFDLVVPFDEKVDFKELEKEVKTKVHNLDNKYYAVINIENSYV